MQADRIIDNKTIATSTARSGSAHQQVERIITNMERWRWLPRDLGKTYVMVNIPDYTLRSCTIKDRMAHQIVAGKPQTPTPLLTAPMQEVIVNPSWYVPQSIIQNELLPQYANDPQIFDRMAGTCSEGELMHERVGGRRCTTLIASDALHFEAHRSKICDRWRIAAATRSG